MGKQTIPAGELDARDLARGAAGALFVSLPLLYTMEMWALARSMPNGVLLAFLALALLLNRWFLRFSGFRCRDWQGSDWWDAVIAIGIGALVSVITLYVTGIATPDLDPFLAAKLVAIETVPTSMGAAVAMNQLGGGDGIEPEDVRLPRDVVIVAASFLGGYLFAFNIAPTEEVVVLVHGADWWHVGGTLLLSLGVSYLMVAVADFEIRDLDKRAIITSEWFEAVVAYLVAFVVSLMLLWLFGHSTPFDPLELWLPQAVMLAYATTIGGAAGRLVL